MKKIKNIIATQLLIVTNTTKGVIKHIATRYRKHAAVILLLIITTVIFWPALLHFFAIDDFFWIWNAKTNSGDASYWIQAFNHINGSGQYRPLSQQVFYWLSYRLFGLDPLGYHLLNFTVFLLTCYFLYRLLFKITSSTVISACSASLFCFSSVHFEHLGWVAAFTETSSILCVVLSLYAISRGKKSMALVWYIVGLGTNETVIILPLLVLAYYILFDRKTIKNSIKSTLGLWIVLIIYMTLRLCVFGGLGAKGVFAISRSPIVWTKEIIHSFWSSLNFNVDLKNIYTSHYHWKLLIITFVIISIGSILFALLSNKNKLTIQPRMIILGITWFIIGLLPVLPFANNFADYTISIGLLGLPIIMIGIFGKTKFLFLYPLLAISVLSISLISMYGPNGLMYDDGYITLANSDKYVYVQMEAVQERVQRPIVVKVIGNQAAVAVFGYQWMAKILSNNSKTIFTPASTDTTTADLTFIYQPRTLSFVVTH
jgi:hypothetical protein